MKYQTSSQNLSTADSKKHKNKHNGLIFAVVIVLSLLAMEIALRFLSPPVYIGVGTRRTPKAELYGWAAVPDRQEVCIDLDTGNMTYYCVNSQGWRDVEHAFAKAVGVTRILFLGDSNTWGSVPIDDLHTRRLEAILKNRGFWGIEIINMGNGGWGTDQELEVLEREGIRYNPDIVIYQFCSNDVIEILSPSRDTEDNSILWAKPFKYELRGGILQKIKLYPREPALRGIRRLLLKSAVIYKLNEFIKWIGYKVEVYKIVRKAKSGDNPVFVSSTGEQIYPQEGWDLLEALILKMQQCCQQYNARLIVFSVQKNTENLRRICNKHSIPLVEPVNEYQHYRYNGHPNKIGNAQIAKDIADFLVNYPPFYEKVRKTNTKGMVYFR